MKDKTRVPFDWRIPITCPQCGQTFIRDHQTKQYCSDECQRKANTKQKKVYVEKHLRKDIPWNLSKDPFDELWNGWGNHSIMCPLR